MIFYMNLLFIVIAVSLDGFGVGITYGMRKIRIPFAALFVIMLCSGVIVMISMMIGQMLRAFISPQVASAIGSTILILIGMFVLFSVFRTNRMKKCSTAGEQNESVEQAQNVALYQEVARQNGVASSEFPDGRSGNTENAHGNHQTFDNTPIDQLKHFKSVLSDPFQADKDKSGTISVSEAFFLGTALALDAFGAGLGAAMLGYAPIITAVLIASMSGLFVFSGIKIGFFLSRNRTIARLTFMPPVLLICIGIVNLF